MVPYCSTIPYHHMVPYHPKVRPSWGMEHTEHPKVGSGGEHLKCHFLPCSVDFSGRVPGAQHFFTPTSIQSSEGKEVLVATLRGRGLMGQEENLSGLDCSANLCVLKIGTDGVLAVDGPCIDRVIEWQHQHVLEPANNTKGQLKSASSWMQVARALHKPLPPPESF